MSTPITETPAGVIVVDKPAGWTSHDVVNRMRHLAATRKVGHLGTLDPLATGVLPVLISGATRLARFFSKSDKVYDATIQFGHSTDTYDADGKPTSPERPVTLDAELLEPLLTGFRGKIRQIPPPVSAKKIDGTPAYKLVRKNVEFTIDPVEIEVYSFDLLRCAGAEVDVRISCSAGTYVRSIAHDLGQLLGTGAFLKILRRICSSGFDISKAHTLGQLANMRKTAHFDEALIPAARLFPEYPTEVVDAITAAFIRNGRDFRVSPFRATHGSRYLKAVSQEGQLIAIGEAKLPLVYHPIVVL